MKLKSKTKTKLKTKKSFLEQVVNFCKASEVPGTVHSYEALLGINRPINDMLGCNHVLLTEMQSLALSAFKKQMKDHPCPVGRQVMRVDLTPGSSAEIGIAALRKAAQVYERAKVDVIGAVKLVPVPCGTDPLGFAISVQLEVLIFGQNAKFKLQQQASRSRSKCAVRKSATEWFEPEDTKVIARAFRRILRPNYAGVPVENLFGDPEHGPDWSKREERNLRAYVVLMALAQLPISKMLILHGAGGPIFAQAMAGAKQTLKAACKKSPAIIHPDCIPHFFFSELRRMGLNEVSVPLVKLR